LVVDDSEQSLVLIELYLKGEPFELVTTRSGREALDLAATQQFDLILADVVMPQMDGFELCRRLKQDPRSSAVPVVFLTARQRDDATRAEDGDGGAADYITKPVDKQ